MPTEQVRIPKAKLFDAMDYHVHAEEVADFHNSTARRRVQDAPARTSKSMSAAAETFVEGLPTMVRHKGSLVPHKTKLNWLVGPNYGTNKEFQYIYEWGVEKNLLAEMGYTVTKEANSPNQGNMQIVAEAGRGVDGRIVRAIYEGKSATNPETLQGEQIHVGCMSEAAEQNERIWTKYLRTRTYLALFPTTPKVKARWLWKLKKSREVATFTFRPQANPEYDYENFWIEHAASEMKTAGEVLTAPGGHECLYYSNGAVKVNPECKAAEDPEFAEQFLGQWTFQMGKILPFQSDPEIGDYCNVIKTVPDWVYAARWMWSFDYGWDHPYVGGLWAIGPDQWALMDAFYRSKLSDPEVARLVTEKEESAAHRFGAKVGHYAPDPRRPEVSKMLARELGVAVFPMDKAAASDRAAGHRMLVNELKPRPETGEPGLVIYDCDGTRPVIEEWDSLCAKDGHFANEWGLSALDGDDHAFDMAKYGAFAAKIIAPRRKRGDWVREFERIKQRILKRPLETSPPLAGPNLEVWNHA